MNAGNNPQTIPAAGPAVAWSHTGEEMEDRIRELDWSKTPLGPIRAWPQSLRTVVNILLSSRYAMWMAWGPELTFFYNDAYRSWASSILARWECERMRSGRRFGRISDR